jgi:hypothetical protein
VPLASRQSRLRPRLFVLVGLAAPTLLLASRATLAQPVPAPRDTARQGIRNTVVNVFLDCGFQCDQDYVRTEVTYVNWVRDRAAADVHVLVTTQGTGGGGREFTLAFLGQRTFAGIGDTLTFVAAQGATPDETRRGLTRTITQGLVPFLARTTLGPRITVTLAPAAPGAAAAKSTPQTQRDPWNLWVYTLGANTFTNGEQSSSFTSINANASARRTTQAWKINFSIRQNYNESTFDLGDGEKSTFIRRSTFANQLAVKSLGPRLSAGWKSSFGSSTFENKSFFARATPAVEYDIFPYSESTRRMLTLQYAAGAESFRYQEETIFLKTRETRPLHTLSLSLSQNQPWGSINAGLEGGQYLNATNKNYASLFGGTSLRLFKGFNFNVSGNLESIHNQLYLPRRGATEQEILTQQRRLATNYSYFVSLGLSYTFGSVLNNVVNPRFGRDGGGGTVFFFD